MGALNDTSMKLSRFHKNIQKSHYATFIQLFSQMDVVFAVPSAEPPSAPAVLPHANLISDYSYVCSAVPASRYPLHALQLLIRNVGRVTNTRHSREAGNPGQPLVCISNATNLQ